MLIRGPKFRTDRRNELLFFKPEWFLIEDKEKLLAIIEMCLRRFERYGVDVSGAILRGSQPGELEIMDRHYGYVNRLSRAVSRSITVADAEQIGQSLGITNMSVYRILGGREFLEAFPAFNSDSLNSLWFTKESVKLWNGFYAQQYEVNGSRNTRKWIPSLTATSRKSL